MEHDLRQGCVLTPLLFTICFAPVINVASTRRFKANKNIMDALVHLSEEEKGLGDGEKQLPERQSWRRRCGACFMLKMPGLSHNHPSS